MAWHLDRLPAGPRVTEGPPTARLGDVPGAWVIRTAQLRESKVSEALPAGLGLLTQPRREAVPPQRVSEQALNVTAAS